MASLLILTQPIHHIIPKLPQVLKKASSHVRERLYVHLDQHVLNKTLDRPKFVPLTQKSCLISMIYSVSPSVCPGIDVRVLMGGFKRADYTPLHTKQNLDKVLIDYVSKPSDLALLKQKYEDIIRSRNSCVLFEELVEEAEGESKECASILCEQIRNKSTLSEHDTSVGNSVDHKDEGRSTSDQTENKIYKDVVIGGTFDRLHPGHKILLSEAILRSLKRLTVGVSDGKLLKRKVLKELILPLSERIHCLTDFLTDVDCCLDFNVVKIDDIFGPTAYDQDMEMIVVSEETYKGVDIINNHRKQNNLRVLDSYCIKVFEDSSIYHHKEEEEKFSSSSQRMRLLGTRLKSVSPNPSIQQCPYVVGLTGGIASGKTNISCVLQELGAGVVDCDKLGHKAYEYGSSCYFKLIETFGANILSENGKIDRKSLGAIVFTDKTKLKLLTDIVWPEIASLANEEIQNYLKEEKKVVILDAAVLLEAKWDTFCHEVWVCIIDREEAVRRVVARDNLTAEDAAERLDKQIANEDRVEKAHVVFCSLWSYEFTRQQVQKAWQTLQVEGKA